MKFFKYSSANLVFSSLLVISSFLYSQEGQAMDVDQEDLSSNASLEQDFNESGNNAPEIQNQHPLTASAGEKATPGGQKHVRDSNEEPKEAPPSKRQRIEEGYGPPEENNFPSSSAVYPYPAQNTFPVFSPVYPYPAQNNFPSSSAVYPYPAQNSFPASSAVYPYPAQNNFPSSSAAYPYPAQNTFPVFSPVYPYPAQNNFPSSSAVYPYPAQNTFPVFSAAYPYSYEQRTAPFASTSSSSTSLSQDSVASLLAAGDRFKTTSPATENINQALRCYEMAVFQGSLEAYVKAAYMHVKKSQTLGYADDLSENDPDSNDHLQMAMTYLKEAGPEIAKIHLNQREVLEIICEYIKYIPENKKDFQTLIAFCRSYPSKSTFNIILGTLYVCGKGVEKDEDKALEYFKNADKLMCEEYKTKESQLGNIFYQVSQALFGNCDEYEYALLEEVSDREKSIKFLEMAVDLKNKDACMKLIDLYSPDLHDITLSALKKARDCLDGVTYEAVEGDQTTKRHFNHRWDNTGKTYRDSERFPLFYTLMRLYASHSPFYDPERSEKFMKLGAKAGNEECIRLCAGQSNILKSLKYILYSSKPEEYKYQIKNILDSMDRITKQADSDLLDSKQLYTLGKMHSYIVRNKKSYLSFLHELPQHDGDEAKEIIGQHYNLGMKYLQQTIKKSQGEALTHSGKPYLQLAKLVLAQHNPENLDQGIEYGRLAYKKGLDKALPLCGQLYALKQQPQMAGSYFFRGFTKGVSRDKKVRDYFKFEKSTSSGTHSSHVIPVFDHNDPFDGKIQGLILLCEEQYQIHTNEPFFSSSSGVTVYLSTDKKKTDGLGPLYKTLHDFGENLQESARDLLAAESSRVGLLVPNVKIQKVYSWEPLEDSGFTGTTQRVPAFFYSDEGEAAEKGFRIVKVKDQELSCLGTGNPKRGSKFKKLMTTWKEEALQAIEKINIIYTQKLNREGLKETERAQLVEEQQKLPALKQAIDDGVEVLERIAHTRAPARAQAMERDYPSLFKD